MGYLTEKMRKRDIAANAVLAAGLIGNLQSPQHFVRSGHIEAPGVQLMQRMMKKRKEANRNLDSDVVSQGARNRTNVPAPSTRERMAAAYDRMKKQKREKANEIIKDLRKEQKTFQDFMLECYELEESSSNKDKLLNAIARKVHTAPNRKERQKWKDIESKHRSRFTPPGKKLWRKGLTQADREDANQQDYDDLDTFGTKSTMDPFSGVSHITKNPRKLRKQKAMGEHPNEEYEYELEESSTGERMGRGKSKLTQFGNLKIKGNVRSPQNTRSRRERVIAAISKKAGLKGTGKLSHHDIKSSPRDYTTYDSEDVEDDYGSTKQDHFIRTYKSPRRAASGEGLISKHRGGKVKPSKDSVRKVKDFIKSMTKAGANKRGRVHNVEIMHRDENIGKGDRYQQMKRGRNFIKAIKDTPKHLNRAGAKKGETVIGKPTAVMDGEDKKTGEEKRAKLYKKIFGKKSTKKSEKTGMMTGAVD